MYTSKNKLRLVVSSLPWFIVP